MKQFRPTFAQLRQTTFPGLALYKYGSILKEQKTKLSTVENLIQNAERPKEYCKTFILVSNPGNLLISQYLLGIVLF